VALLHCVSLYPLESDKANLLRITRLAERFGCRIGFSDHSTGVRLAGIAAALGARIFEKHFMHVPGFACPDSGVSVTPDEFAVMKKAVEDVVVMMGSGAITTGEAEKGVAISARRSLCAARDIPAGKALERDDVVPLRPGVGMPAYRLDDLLGRTSLRPIRQGSILRMDYFTKG
jgi:N,N'-diacetyllegionaminate synthase